MSNKNWLLLILLASFWGTSFLFNAIALRSTGHAAVVTYRMLIAASVLWLMAWQKSWEIPKGRIWLHFFIAGQLMCALPFSLIVWGQQYVESGLASILNAGTAVFGAALSPIFFADERMTWRRALGISVGFLGIIIAIGIDNLSHFSLYNLGQWAIVLATLSYAAGGIYSKKFMRQVRSEVSALGMVSMAALTMTIILIFGSPGSDIAPSLGGWVSIIYLAIIGTAIAYMLYYYLLREVGVANTALVTLILPVFSIILGALVLHESLSINDYIGFALLALGLIILDGRVFRLLRGNQAR